MRTGSVWTFFVAGAYWISSKSRLRNTTLPGVTATFSPGRKFSVPAGSSRLRWRRQSSIMFSKPRIRFCPPSFCVAWIRSGLVQRKFAGENRSMNCRAMKETTF